MKKLLSLLSPRKPWLCILVLLTGVVSGLITSSSHTDSGSADAYHLVTSVEPQDIRDTALTPDGLIAVNEKSQTTPLIYTADTSGRRMNYLLGYKSLSDLCGFDSRREIVFGDNGELFLHYLNWSETYNVINFEGVIRISPDGRNFDKLCGFDYTDDDLPPIHEPRLSAFQFSDGRLTFAYTDPRVTELYSVDTETCTQTLTASYETTGDVYISRVMALDGRYMFAASDGNVYIADESGVLGDPVYTCEVVPDSVYESEIILNAAEVDGCIYVTDSFCPDTVYRLDNNELVPVLTLEELYPDLDGDLWDEYALEITKLSSCGGKLLIGTRCDLFTLADDELEQLELCYKVPAANLFAGLSAVGSKLLQAAGAVLLVIFLILVRKTILIKQLMITIPVTLVMLTVIFITTQKHVREVFLSSCVSEMTGIAELCARQIDADRLTPDPADHKYTADTLFSITNRGQSYWSSSYDIKIFIPSDDEDYALIYAASCDENAPYSAFGCNYSLETLEEGYLDDSMVSFYSYDNERSFFDYLTLTPASSSYEAITPIFRPDGSYAAFLTVTYDSVMFVNALNSVTFNMLLAQIPCALLLVAAITAISVYISAMIKKATDTVTKIADGDFSARVDSHARDELGEICRSVNTMASSLDTMFREKDENEQFYYKFVPEKFRELLGKERFTDLELGDAESRELTVLFCDIRSFSINSEIMTAKENFEFVNVIYGKAGPLVRKYGGFVDKYIGDAVMALFESPDNAVACGIELYHSIVLDPSTSETLGVSEINIGIGIHTGMARIGIVGESERLSGTVISDTVNLSSRLESLTKQFHTAMLISKDTLDRMTDPDSLDLRYLGILQVAGVNEVNAVYEVLDCLDGELRQVRSGNKNELREAIRLFHLGRRSESAGMLQSIIDSGKADETVEKYRDYITGMSDDDKGNVFRFVNK